MQAQDSPDFSNCLRATVNICMGSAYKVLTFDKWMSSIRDSHNSVPATVSDGQSTVANNGMHADIVTDGQTVQCLQEFAV